MTDSTSTLPQAPPRRRRVWPFLLLLAALLGGGGVYWNIRRKAEALHRFNWAKIPLPERLARVPGDWSAATLASRLRESRKIRDAATFEEAAAQVGLAQVKPGGYLLPRVAGPLELAQAFKAGPTHERVTFPEGFTVRQIGARLQKNGFAGGAALAQGDPTPLEGRLFPNTYWLQLRAPGLDVVAPMQRKWRAEIASLPRPWPKIGGRELSAEALTTLASLVEREAASSAEMPLIAGVLLGRLRRPMRLQVDASVQYARARAALPYKSRLTFDDLKIASPYNTYTRDGLPPAPICNPGAAALRAVARPQNTAALFYVYSPRLKKHIFAPDFEGHKHNVAIVRQEAAQLAAE